MNKLFLVAIVLSVTGCSSEVYWDTRKRCVTQEQVDKASSLAKDFLSSTPNTLSGDDQDYDDAVIAAKNTAIEIACPTVLVEYTKTHMGYPRETGKWKYTTEVE